MPSPKIEDLTQPLEYASIEEWRAESERRFGADALDWKFVCPSCGHVATIQDWKDLGASSAQAAFSCVGRYMDPPSEVEMCPDGPGHCNYSGGGLIRLNPIKIDGGGNPFAFAEDGKKPA